MGFQKFICVLVSAAFLATNCVLAYQPELGFWAERQRAVEAIQGKEGRRASPLRVETEKFVNLPPNAQQIYQSFPTVQSQPLDLTSSIPKKSQTRLPKGFSSEVSSIIQSIPSQYGIVREIVPAKRLNTKPSHTVVLVQDVHQNHDAQKNIAGLIQCLREKVGVVGLEGAFGGFDFSAFHAFPDQDVVRKVADYFLKESRISGAAYAGIMHSSLDPLSYIGVDDKTHYEANVEAYCAAQEQLPVVREQLAEIKEKTEEKKKRILNPALKEFDQKVQSYHSHKIRLGQYVRTLVNKSKTQSSKSKVKPYKGKSGIGLFLRALDMEESLDFKAVQAERTQVIQQLVRKLGKEDVMQLVHWGVAYRTGQMQHGDFYEALLGICGKAGVSLSHYPAMNDYVQYALLSDKIKAQDLFKEIGQAEKLAYSALVKTEEERQLVQEAKHLYLMSKLVNFSLTTEEWEEYKKQTKDQRPKTIDHRPQDLAVTNAYDAQRMTIPDFSSFENFYKHAEARDELMVANLIKEWDLDVDKVFNRKSKIANQKSLKSPLTILVAGGFHTPGITKHLSEAGMTTVVMTPKIRKVETAHGSSYLSVFAQEKTPLEKLFEGEKLFLAQNPMGLSVFREMGSAAGSMAVQLGSDQESVVQAVQRFFSTGWRILIEVKNRIVQVIAQSPNGSKGVVCAQMSEGELVGLDNDAYAPTTSYELMQWLSEKWGWLSKLKQNYGAGVVNRVAELVMGPLNPWEVFGVYSGAGYDADHFLESMPRHQQVMFKAGRWLMLGLTPMVVLSVFVGVNDVLGWLLASITVVTGWGGFHILRSAEDQGLSVFEKLFLGIGYVFHIPQILVHAVLLNGVSNLLLLITGKRFIPVWTTGKESLTEVPLDKKKIVHSHDDLLLMKVDYGFLPDDHKAVEFVRQRMAVLLTGCPEVHLPQVEVLAARGEGVNAMAFANGTIVVTPELLAFVEHVEELDHVLLHELNHVLEGHITAIESAQRESWLEAVGMVRYAEYEADMKAFYQAGDPQRQTNPLGAIVFHERLRDLMQKNPSGVGWDLAHGDVNHRILNMKTVLRFLDFVSVDRKLCDLPMDLDLPNKNYKQGLGYLLKHPPTFLRSIDYANQEDWLSGLEQYLDQADMPVLEVAMGFVFEKICELRGLNNQVHFVNYESTLASCESVFRRMTRTWNAQFEERFKSLSDEERRMAKVIFLTEQTSLPVFYDKDGKRLAVMNQIKDPVISQIKKEFKRFLSSAVAESGIDPLGLCADVFRGLIQIGAMTREKNKKTKDEWDVEYVRFFVWLANESFVCYQNEDDSVNVGRYLQGCQKVADVIFENFAHAEDFIEDESGADYVDWVWSHLVIRGALNLDDMEKLDDSYWEVADALKVRYRFCDLKLEALEKLNEMWEKEDFKRVCESGRICLDSRIEIMRKYFKPDVQVSLKDQNQKKIWIDMVDALGFGDIYEFLEPMLLRENRSFDEVKTCVRVFQLAARNEREYEDLIVSVVDSGLQNMTFEQINELAEVVRDFKGVERIFGRKPFLQSSRLRLEDNYICQALMMKKLDELLEKKKQDPDAFFGLMENFLQKWPVQYLLKKLKNREDYEVGIIKMKIKAGKRIVAQARRVLDLCEKDGNQYYERMFMAGFFVRDSIVKQTFQKVLLERILQGLTFDEALDMACYKYTAQDRVGDLETIELLDKMARSKEDFVSLKRAFDDVWRQMLDPKRLGMGVGLEFVSEILLKKTDRMDLFFDLVTTSLPEKYDEPLKERLVNVWWLFMGGVIMDAINYDFEDIEDTVKYETEYGKVETVYEKIVLMSPEGMLKSIYSLGLGGRYALLRVLLLGEMGGLLKQRDHRIGVLDKLFDNFVCFEKGTTNEFEKRIYDIYRTVFVGVDSDELFLMLEPLLRSRIGVARAGFKGADWEPYAENLANKHTFKLDNVEIPHTTLDDIHPEKIMELHDPDSEPDESFVVDPDESFESYFQEHKKLKSLCLKYLNMGRYEEDDVERENNNWARESVNADSLDRTDVQMSPIQLIRESAQQLGAPGVRFLQLLCHMVDIPGNYREELFDVFDNVKGQHKVFAWKTIEREDPVYAEKIDQLGDRIGGGSLFTVYEVLMKDGTEEVVKVLNPNALCLANSSIEIIEKTLRQLAEADASYEKALQLPGMLQEWVEQELSDSGFEADDERFREKWNANGGWRPSEEWESHVVVPQTIAKTKRIHREEKMKGQTFKHVIVEDESGVERKKEIMSLAVQHYVAQITGMEQGEEEVLVHSDVSPGNLFLTDDGHVAILDRGMYLRLSQADVAFLTSAFFESDLHKRIGLFVSYFGADGQADLEKVADEIFARVSGLSGLNEITLKIMVEMFQHGIEVPLKFSLLFKNFNVLDHLCQDVHEDFTIQDALFYTPHKKEIDQEKGLRQEAQVFEQKDLLVAEEDKSLFGEADEESGVVFERLLDREIQERSGVPEDVYFSWVARQAVKENIFDLREKLIFCFDLAQGWSVQELSDLLGVEVARIRELKAKVYRKVRHKLKYKISVEAWQLAGESDVFDVDLFLAEVFKQSIVRNMDLFGDFVGGIKEGLRTGVLQQEDVVRAARSVYESKDWFTDKQKDALVALGLQESKDFYFARSCLLILCLAKELGVPLSVEEKSKQRIKDFAKEFFSEVGFSVQETVGLFDWAESKHVRVNDMRDKFEDYRNGDQEAGKFLVDSDEFVVILSGGSGNTVDLGRFVGKFTLLSLPSEYCSFGKVKVGFSWVDESDWDKGLCVVIKDYLNKENDFVLLYSVGFGEKTFSLRRWGKMEEKDIPVWKEVMKSKGDVRDRKKNEVNLTGTFIKKLCNVKESSNMIDKRLRESGLRKASPLNSEWKGVLEKKGKRVELELARAGAYFVWVFSEDQINDVIEILKLTPEKRGLRASVFERFAHLAHQWEKWFFVPIVGLFSTRFLRKYAQKQNMSEHEINAELRDMTPWMWGVGILGNVFLIAGVALEILAGGTLSVWWAVLAWAASSGIVFSSVHKDEKLDIGHWKLKARKHIKLFVVGTVLAGATIAPVFLFFGEPVLMGVGLVVGVLLNVELHYWWNRVTLGVNGVLLEWWRHVVKEVGKSPWDIYEVFGSYAPKEFRADHDVQGFQAGVLWVGIGVLLLSSLIGTGILFGYGQYEGALFGAVYSIAAGVTGRLGYGFLSQGKWEKLEVWKKIIFYAFQGQHMLTHLAWNILANLPVTQWMFPALTLGDDRLLFDIREMGRRLNVLFKKGVINARQMLVAKLFFGIGLQQKKNWKLHEIMGLFEEIYRGRIRKDFKHAMAKLSKMRNVGDVHVDDFHIDVLLVDKFGKNLTMDWEMFYGLKEALEKSVIARTCSVGDVANGLDRVVENREWLNDLEKDRLLKTGSNEADDFYCVRARLLNLLIAKEFEISVSMLKSVKDWMISFVNDPKYEEEYKQVGFSESEAMELLDGVEVRSVQKAKSLSERLKKDADNKARKEALKVARALVEMALAVENLNSVDSVSKYHDFAVKQIETVLGQCEKLGLEDIDGSAWAVVQRAADMDENFLREAVRAVWEKRIKERQRLTSEEVFARVQRLVVHGNGGRIGKVVGAENKTHGTVVVVSRGMTLRDVSKVLKAEVHGNRVLLLVAELDKLSYVTRLLHGCRHVKAFYVPQLIEQSDADWVDRLKADELDKAVKESNVFAKNMSLNLVIDSALEFDPNDLPAKSFFKIALVTVLDALHAVALKPVDFKKLQRVARIVAEMA